MPHDTAALPHHFVAINSINPDLVADWLAAAGLEVTEEGKHYGRGAFDMKGSLAAIMSVGATARERRLRGDVIITAVADEEYASVGTAGVVKRITADAAIVTAPTALQVCVAHKGFLLARCGDDRRRGPRLAPRPRRGRHRQDGPDSGWRRGKSSAGKDEGGD